MISRIGLVIFGCRIAQPPDYWSSNPETEPHVVPSRKRALTRFARDPAESVDSIRPSSSIGRWKVAASG